MFVCANKVQINISFVQNLLFFYFSLDYFNFFSFLKHCGQVQISTNCYQPKTVYFVYLSIIYPNISKKTGPGKCRQTNETWVFWKFSKPQINKTKQLFKWFLASKFDLKLYFTHF